MKHSLLRLSILALLLTVKTVASALDFEVDGIYYKTISSSTVEVTSHYKNMYYNPKLLYSGESIVIPESVSYDGATYTVTALDASVFYGCDNLKSISIPNSVTSIGTQALSRCSGLSSLTIPNSVTSIGNNAFEGCVGLKSIIIPNSVTSIEICTFRGCNNLESVTIGNGVTSIGSRAFEGCISLKSIIIPNSVTSIWGSAFEDCPLESVTLLCPSVGAWFNGMKSLKELVLGDGVTTIGDGAFEGCVGLKSVIIPNSVTSIEHRAFYECSNLESVTIGNSVTSIGSYAFDGCIGLKSIIIPNSVTSIEYSAFAGCSGLTSITIGNSVNTIGRDAFRCCSNLESVTIGNGVTEIGGGAFMDCVSLKSIIIPNSVTSIEYSAFDNCPLESVTLLCPNVENWFKGKKSLKELVLGDGVTSIGADAFYNCNNLTSALIGNSVTSIGYSAFRNCSSLTSITIGNGVTTIGHDAFYGCSSLASVTIGNGVTIIEYDAFYGCSSLASVTIPNSVTTIGRDAFNGCSSLASVTIGNSVKSIGDWAFYRCDSIKSVTLLCPTVGTWFSGIKSIKEVVLGDGVTSIGSSAFPYYANLKLLGEMPPILNKPDYPYRYYSRIEVPKGSSWRYSTAENWCETDTIFAMDGNRVLYPIPIVKEDISVVKVNGNADGTEAEEGAEVEITVANNEHLPYSLIVFDNHEVTNPLMKDGKYVIRVSSNHKENVVLSYCYPYTDIALSKSGTLIDQLGIDNIATLECLKVSGDINGTDILTIRKMKNLKLLDLSEAHIVNGGMSYYENYTTSENTIGEHFYDGLEKLQRIKLPNDIQKISRFAFASCKNIITMTIPRSVNYMCDEWCNPMNESLLSLQIEDLDKWCEVRWQPFYIGFPEKIKARYHLFLNDEEIIDLNLPEGLKVIPSNSFYGCKWLRSLTIPSSVTDISKIAFWGCDGITSVISLNPIPPLITSEVFTVDYKKTTLYVPQGSKTLYWLHPYWEKFKNIEEIEVSSINNPLIDDVHNGRIYNLNGTRVDGSALGKGIYIRNGKKVVIK